MYIVSACLLGHNVKYDGGNNYSETIEKFLEDKEFILVCPETSGGLKSPRKPCEKNGNRVLNADGEDLTEAFLTGAGKSLEYVLNEADEDIEGAILRARSPSCGAGEIYDGTFSHKRVMGDGCLAELLRARGIRLITDEELIETINKGADND